MTHIVTPHVAADMLFPLSRTFADKTPVAGCRGPACMAWRWQSVTTQHPLCAPAVKAEAARTGESVPYRKAAAYVAENQAALGMIPTHGHCGLGGA